MKRFNKEKWVGFLLLAGWSLYLLYLLTEGEIISFIHPKRIPLMWGALLGMVILTFYQSTKLFTIPSRKTQLYSYMPLGLVLMCGIFLLTTNESDRLPSRQTQKPLTILSKENNAIKPEVIADEVIPNDRNINQGEPNNEQDTPAMAMASDKIVLNDDNYTKTLTDIEQNPDVYIGKKIQLEGFVYRDAQFAPDDFVIARMFMLCCAADAQVTGLMSTWNESSTLENKQWLRVEGVLKTKTYEMDGQKSLMPIIQIETVTKLPTPDNQYVYY